MGLAQVSCCTAGTGALRLCSLPWHPVKRGCPPGETVEAQMGAIPWRDEGASIQGYPECYFGSHKGLSIDYCRQALNAIISWNFFLYLCHFKSTSDARDLQVVIHLTKARKDSPWLTH